MVEIVELRTAGLADITALDRLFQRSYARLLTKDYPPSILVTAIPVIGRAQPVLVRSGQFYIAERSGTIAGAGGWSMQPPGGQPGRRGVGHVRHVATDPDHVRAGVGRAVLEHIVMMARASGMFQLQAQSTMTAVPFYRAMGFEAQGEISVPLRAGLRFPAMLMSIRV